MKKLRICHIATQHFASDVRIFHRECYTLVQAGYEVHLVVPFEESESESGLKDGVHVHLYRCAKSRAFRMLFTPWVAFLVAIKTRAQIYHYHDLELMFIGFLLRWVFGKKVVFDIHEPVRKQIINKGWLPKWSRKPVGVLYTLVERILTPGQALVIANLGSVPDYPPSAYLVRNYPRLNEQLIAQARETAKDTDVPLLIYIGSVAISRGAEVYVELAHQLAKRGHKFRMMIVGWDNENCIGALESRIRQLNLADKVTFTGQLSHEEAVALVVQATIGLCLLLPTPNYTLALATKILEYMMLGTPVLASDFDCWREFVEGTKSGRMVNPCNIEQVVSVCEEMLADPDELAAMGQRGMAAVRDKYNWSSEADVLLKCYEDLQKG